MVIADLIVSKQQSNIKAAETKSITVTKIIYIIKVVPEAEGVKYISRLYAQAHLLVSSTNIRSYL